METIVHKPWGSEVIWAQAEGYVGKTINIFAGRRLSRQYHEHKTETIRIVRGRMLLELGIPGADDFQYFIMNPGDSFHIAQGLVHRMCGISDVELTEVSTDFLDDVVRLEDDYNRQ